MAVRSTSLRGTATISINGGSQVPSPSPSSVDLTTKEVLKPRANSKKYEATCQQGFSGTYDEWVVNRTRSNRKHGGAVGTLSLEKALKADQFFHFPPNLKNHSGGMLRTLLHNGRRIGRAVLNVPSRKDEWLCPYFDPDTRSLRYWRKDGQDSGYALELSTLAQGKRYRPLLVLAQAEGLLDNIPDATLPSLDLKSVLEGGYYTKTPLQIRPHYRYPLVSLCYYPKTESAAKLARLDLCLDTPKEEGDVRTFPYVDDNCRLALWNVDEGNPFRLSGRGYVDGTIPPEVVKKRFPIFFTWAQQLGNWTDL